MLCFTQFTEFAERLLPHLSARFDSEVLYLHGGTPKKRRDEMVATLGPEAWPPPSLERFAELVDEPHHLHPLLRNQRVIAGVGRS